MKASRIAICSRSTTKGLEGLRGDARASKRLSKRFMAVAEKGRVLGLLDER